MIIRKYSICFATTIGLLLTYTLYAPLNTLDIKEINKVINKIGQGQGNVHELTQQVEDYLNTKGQDSPTLTNRLRAKLKNAREQYTKLPAPTLQTVPLLPSVVTPPAPPPLPAPKIISPSPTKKPLRPLPPRPDEPKATQQHELQLKTVQRQLKTTNRQVALIPLFMTAAQTQHVAMIVQNLMNLWSHNKDQLTRSSALQFYNSCMLLVKEFTQPGPRGIFYQINAAIDIWTTLDQSTQDLVRTIMTEFKVPATDLNIIIDEFKEKVRGLTAKNPELQNFIKEITNNKDIFAFDSSIKQLKERIKILEKKASKTAAQGHVVPSILVTGLQKLRASLTASEEEEQEKTEEYYE